ncbi:hypothetical protein CLOBY_00350 [Clostridium saccharobutylicum]|uniref:hypothetical protein n=1 Tax=Clostridium saccharobutylicum TaxID=169679 RepID=UPI000983E8B8|nr:hypothetical protein [Clostridium saccharobutylicum]AQS07986.1 hypothetical protein CLOBY_00350 [Clostridium saccharobutylicum]MBC2436963.1 hypothetical protein [Clostridium saccharobutylicum]NSB89314.1 hypothetical protein [Clostridium saccharobutylicum]NYC29696.1 hypothetical protein [Clostridium saccharobutylicum]OOM17317.1 hypothetical protein CLSAB_17420 [Clostridium saccharobutylicum]
MLVNDILNEISKKDGVSNYTFIPISRWSEFQNTPTKEHIDFIEDINFEDFYNHLNKVFSSRVRRTTAVKILNNGYFI